MRIHLLRKETIEGFARRNAQSRTYLNDWLAKLRKADWQMPADIKTTFKTADLLGKGSGRVVFDIGGNNYRIICKYHWGITMIHLSIKWIGTHDAYNELCSKNEQYTISLY